MSLIRRQSLPKLISTADIASRWNLSTERVRQILNKEGARKVQAVKAVNAKFSWYETDVERVEQKIFGATL